jgi:hypothetical protein
MKVRAAHVEGVGQRSERADGHLMHRLGTAMQLLAHPGHQCVVMILGRSFVEGALDRVSQECGVDGLLHVVRDPHAQRSLRRALVTRRRRQDDADARVVLERLVGQLEARHLSEIE